MAESRDDTEWLAAFNFEVQLAPVYEDADLALTQTASFAEVSGLQIDISSVEIREGGYNRGTRKLIGKASQPQLVLKRGMTTDKGFWTWVQQCLSGRFPVPYVNGSILVFDRQGTKDREPKATWEFSNGIATQVRAPTLDAGGGKQVAIEELHIAHEELVRL